MVNEDSWIQRDVLNEQPMQGVGRLLTSNLWFTLPEFCKFVDERIIPVLHSSSRGLSSQAVKRPYSPWYSEGEFSSRKRPTARDNLWNWGGTSCSRQLASFPCPASPAENPHSKVVECFGDVSCLTKDTGNDSSGLRQHKCVDTDVSSTSSRGVASLPMSFDSNNFSENWELRAVASSRCKSPSLVASDVIGTIDFDADGNHFATGGIARKIRICSYAKMISDDIQKSFDEEDELFTDEDDEDLSQTRPSSARRGRRNSGPFLDHGDCAVAEICTPGKLSSLKWRPDGSDVIGCGDYDGVVSEWDIEHKHTVSERYEHCGQRVWSLDYSTLTPTLAASAGGDGAVRLWSRGSEKSVSTIRPPSRNSLCCAEFSPFSQYLIGIASADSNVYLYDLRNQNSSLLQLVGHEKAVSYVRFLGKDNVVSASVDSTLKLWDISSQWASAEDDDLHCDIGNLPGAHLERTFRDHLNVKNFVGLSVHRGAGILACGSETNEVFIYRRPSSTPLQRHKLPSDACLARERGSGGANPFIGAVCWREIGNNYSMVAANSEGVVQVLQARKVDIV